jgi:undecaprenyl phosphate-alpha-L-ara4N flippase subunit ArnE
MLVAFYIFLCAILVAVREICFKRAAHNSPLLQTLQKPLIWLGLVLWAAELALWLRVLQLAPIGVAFPSMAISYVMILGGSAMFLGERMTRRHMAGAALVLIGVAFVGISG